MFVMLDLVLYFILTLKKYVVIITLTDVTCCLERNSNNKSLLKVTWSHQHFRPICMQQSISDLQSTFPTVHITGMVLFPPSPMQSLQNGTPEQHGLWTI